VSGVSVNADIKIIESRYRVFFDLLIKDREFIQLSKGRVE